ncbi:PIG-P-domain-containing protein [Jimgerdemannia flammicorona]|uniref:PIG-P-domain-containing protein n=1 Tax=Jimgerdemannia flammicorona TaxID=994334 RepID=A0A433QVX3_9FUNG|nr:PIG-P-domain-containing protein [Jimgerdemannia flammicorona]
MDHHLPHQHKDLYHRRPRTPQQQPLLVAPVPTRALPHHTHLLSSSPPPVATPPPRSASPNLPSAGVQLPSPKPLRSRPRPLSFHSQLASAGQDATSSSGVGLAPPTRSTGSGSIEWHGPNYFELQRMPSPMPSSSGLWTSRTSTAIKRTASFNSFLSSKGPTDSGASSSTNIRSGLRYHVRRRSLTGHVFRRLVEENESCRLRLFLSRYIPDDVDKDANLRVLRVCAVSRVIPGVRWVSSSLGCASGEKAEYIYCGLSSLMRFSEASGLLTIRAGMHVVQSREGGSCARHSDAHSKYDLVLFEPCRYWALAVPVWTFMLILFGFVTFIALSMMNTAPFDSFTAITDEHANIVSNLAHNAHISEDFIPELQDIPIGVVNAVLYQDLSKLLDDDDEDEWEAEREREMVRERERMGAGMGGADWEDDDEEEEEPESEVPAAPLGRGLWRGFS